MPRAAATLADGFPSARFGELDGRAELAVAEAAHRRGARAPRVTATLGALFDEIGGEPGGSARARLVSAAGREWLLNRAALRFAGDQKWFEAACADCGDRFDISFSLRDLPREEPGQGFPVVSVETSLGLRSFEAPNGGHEEAFARTRGSDARRVFAALCGLADEAGEEAARFTEEDLANIDAALEVVAPQVADSIQAACPNCGAQQSISIDPLEYAFPRVETLLREVHSIAAAYKWSEGAILDLPTARRRKYVELINATNRRRMT
jgi:hypothetical protein